MTDEREPIPRPGLSHRQQQLLDMFLEIGRHHEATTTGQVHAMDQATAFMRGRFAKQGTNLDTAEDFFYVVAGLNVGTIWVAGILEQQPEFSVEHAINALRVSLDQLAPSGSRQFEAPKDPAAIAWYDQTTAFVRNFLVDTMEQDIGNPRIFNQVSAGMTVGTEWMRGLLDQGYPAGQAAHMTCVACSLLAPEG